MGVAKRIKSVAGLGLFVGLFMGLQASSTAMAAEEGSVRNLLTFYGGYQMAKYSYDDSDMSVAGVYLGVGTSVLAEWLEFEGTLGYSVGDAKDLNNALVSDFETVHLNAVLKPTYHIDNFSVYGKLGLNYTSIFYSVGWGVWSSTAVGGVYGGGASYEFDNGFGLSAEVLSYIGTDTVKYDPPSDGSRSGGEIDYSPEVRIGAFFSF